MIITGETSMAQRNWETDKAIKEIEKENLWRKLRDVSFTEDECVRPVRVKIPKDI